MPLQHYQMDLYFWIVFTDLCEWFTFFKNNANEQTLIYFCRLSVPDLKPNIGLFWYFFTEMFEHFHLLFICTFQINAFIYFIPLTLRFEKEPALLIYTFCAIVTIFKSYPSAADLGLYMALIPMWKHLAPCNLSLNLFRAFVISGFVNI